MTPRRLRGLLARMPQGAASVRLLAVVGPMVVYVVLWTTFFWPIWDAGNGPAPKLSGTAVYVVSLIGGVLGTFFAAVFGIQRKGDNDVRKFRGGVTLLGYETGHSNVGTVIASLAVWVYALVGSWALLTVLVHEAQSPKPLKAMATAFASLIFAMFATALVPGQNPPASDS